MKSEYLYDKNNWKPGPWQKEIDRCLWIDEITFYPCIIRRNLYGAWVGYVGVDELHPLFQIDLNSDEYNYINVHGGVRFAGFSKEDDIEFSPPKRLWWIGFSCTTPHDICPRIEPDATKKAEGAIYRNMPFAVEETTFLAQQIASFDSRQNIGDIDDRKINPDGRPNTQADGTISDT